jgi:hypothetical protein
MQAAWRGGMAAFSLQRGKMGYARMTAETFTVPESRARRQFSGANGVTRLVKRISGVSPERPRPARR